MLILLFTLLFTQSTCHKSIPLSILKPDDFCQLTSSITKVLNPYQIVLLVDDSLKQTNIEAKYIKKCILQDYPTVTVDYHKLFILKRIMDYPTFGSPRSSTLFILLETSAHQEVEDNFSQFQKVLDRYSTMWSRPIRPRWLTIYLNKGQDYNDTFDTLLLHAWHKKFLDFTILEARSSNELVVRHFNPFLNVFKTELYTEGANLFPDKLHDMNGYSLNTIFIHEPPSVFLEQNSNGDIIGINSTDFWSVQATFETINATLSFLPTFPNDYANSTRRRSFTELNKAIYEGRIDFSGNRMYLWEHDVLERSHMLWPEGYCAVVPVLPKEQLKLPNRFYLALIVIVFFGIALGIAIKLLQFDRRLWNWLTMFRVL